MTPVNLAEPTGAAPDLARRIAAIAASMGATSVKTGTIEMLCEAAHDHATRALECSVRAASHAGRATLEAEDLKLAVLTLRRRAAQPVSNVEAAEASRIRNNSPLPRMRAGVVLPPDASLTEPLPAPPSHSGLGRLDYGAMPWAVPLQIGEQSPTGSALAQTPTSGK